MTYLHHASFGICVLGVLVIVFGVFSGLVRFVRAEFCAAHGLAADEARKELRDHAKDQIDANEEAASDLDSIVDAITHGSSNDRADGDDPIGRYREATDGASRLHTEVADALLDLKDESEPGWTRRVDYGRLSVRRLAQGADADQLFDDNQARQCDKYLPAAADLWRHLMF